jgi:hypothetical protein
LYAISVRRINEFIFFEDALIGAAVAIDKQVQHYLSKH